VIADLPDQTIDESTSIGVRFRFADSDTPLAMATLSFVSAVSNNQVLVPNSAITIGGSGGDRTVTVRPPPHANGTATITLTVSDGSTTASDSFVLTVTPIAETPTLASTVSTREDTATPVGALTITRNPNDGPEVKYVRITELQLGQLFVNDLDTAAREFVAFNAGGKIDLRFLPTPNTSGVGGFRVQASTTADEDGLGGDVVSTAISVVPVNDQPSFTPGTHVTVLEDSGAYSQPWATNISPGPNEASQTVAFQVIANTDPTLFSVQPAITPSGTLSFTPALNANGGASITVVLKDDGGTVNGGVDTSAAQSFIINVVAANDPPTAMPDTFSVTAGLTVTVPAPGVLANDLDPDSAVLQAQLVSGPSHGSVTLNPNGGFTYTPTAGSTVPDSFTYRASDGAATSDPVAVTLLTTVPPNPCEPRPRVDVQTTQNGPGTLRVVVTATTNAGQPANVLRSIQVAHLDNAVVDVPVQLGVRTARSRIDSPQMVTVDAASSSVEMSVRRVNPGAFTAYLSVLDGCGPVWSTFVGGGIDVP